VADPVRRPIDRRLLICFGLLAAIPTLVAMAYALTDDWVPLGDNGYIGIRAYDVFTGRTPLVGQRSSGASGVLEETAYSPGPLLFWLLAIPVRLPDPAFMSLTTGAVNVASIAGTVALAFRRGRWPLMVATALAIPIMLASLPAETYADVWNSSAPLMPLMLLVFLAWSVACGEYRLLPLTVLVASFATQSHLTFLGPAVGLTLVGVACAVAFGSARRWPRGWIVAALVVGLVCWSAPLVDQAIHRPGNLVTLGKSAVHKDASVGFSGGWKAVAHMVGIPPWWLQDDRPTLARLGDLTVRPGALSIVSALLVVAALAALAVLGWRQRRADLCAAGLLGLTLCVAVGLATSSTPLQSFANVSYTLRWAAPAGMCVWLMLGWGAAVLMRARIPDVGRVRLPVGVAAAVVVAAVATIVAIGENPPRAQPYQSMRAISDTLEASLPAEGATRVDVSSAGDALGLTTQLEVGTIFWMRRHGRAVVAPRKVADRLSARYAQGHYARVLHIDVGVPRKPGGRVIGRLRASDSLDQKTRDVILTLRRSL
jgi:hypothetical protein